MRIKYGSVCSGIEAATVAWHSLGWEAAWLSEIEAFPSAVLAHHYPDVPNLGDMTKITPMILDGSVEAPDVFVGGTPCQAFSVAGLRNSLEDDRGQLSITYIHTLDAIDIVRQSRGEQPCIAVWENVPGVLSTKDNAFGCFLAGLSGEDDALLPPRGKWTNAGCVVGPKRTVAWRVLDAQYFGVAQRRRRVFVVASAREDFSPPKVLFEFEGMRRDTPPSREKREATAGDVGFGIETSGPLSARDYKDPGTDGLNRTSAKMVPVCASDRNAIAFDCSSLGGGWAPQNVNPTEDVCSTMNCTNQKAVAYDQQRTGVYGDNDLASTCAARDYKDATDLVVQPIAFKVRCGCEGGGKGFLGSEETAFTLSTTNDQHIAQPSIVHGTQDPCNSDIAFAQGRNNGGENVLIHAMQVRRLTPVECERLQGFPDNYTNIPWRKKDESPDGPRYKALGNSMAVPVMKWIGERIQMVEDLCKLP